MWRIGTKFSIFLLHAALIMTTSMLSVYFNTNVCRWDNGNNQIAFSRGGRAFIAFNNEYSSDMSVTLQTGMPSGTYCDVISGEISADGSSCSGNYVDVDGSGNAYISLSATSEDPYLAIHERK